MTPYAAGLLAQLVLTVLGLAAATLASGRARSVAAGALVALLGVAGVATGAAGLSGDTGGWALQTPLPGVTLLLQGTPLGGLFTALAGAVGAAAGIFGIGYAHGVTASRTCWSALLTFLLGLQLVPAAGDVVSFLAAWEVMALGSTVLVLAEHALRAGVRAAGLCYAAMTHLSFLLVAAGLALLAAHAGGSTFDAIAAAPGGAEAGSVAFVLLLLGFAAKSGAVPLHVWLPRAHPEAPSHVSALMSAAMVKMGVYGVLLVTTRLLPGGPGWWGLAILALGLPSALYGILQASVASDLKRLLAYSTAENIGLILVAVGLAQVSRAHGNAAIADTATVAAVLLTLSHASFKTTLFLAAGAILHATGERDLDRLGGLATRMPVTSACLAEGALGAAALPVSGGFVAEWTLLQALIHADARTDRAITALLPLVIAVVALTAGLALLTFTKTVGIAVLARPRGAPAATATEVPPSMRIAQLLAAATVLLTGLVPGLVVAALPGVLPVAGAAPYGAGGLLLPAVATSLDPVVLLGVGAALTLPLLVSAAAMARRAPRRGIDLGWGCGGVRTSPRMQYTATSYAEPLVRVFHDALSPTRDVDITKDERAGYMLRAMTYSQSVGDIVETRLYGPAVRGMRRVGDLGRRIHNGDIHRYLAFSFAALVAVLIGALR